MNRPSPILFLSAIISKRWSKLRVSQSFSSKRKLMRWRSSQRNLLLTVVKGLKMRTIFRNKFNKLSEIVKISKVKSSNMILWLLKNLKKRENNFRSSITVHFMRRKNRFTRKTRKMASLKKISILKPTSNFHNTSTSRMKNTQLIPNTPDWSMVLKRSVSMKLSSMKEECNWNNSRKNMKSRKDSWKPWTKSKRKERKTLTGLRLKKSNSRL